MKSTQNFFSRKMQMPYSPHLRLPTKIGNFEWQKSLWALQGYFVITDQKSPFEWIGSVGAYPCIINLIHAVNYSGEKVATCAHLSIQSPNSIAQMLKLIDAQTILSVSLFSGCSNLSDPYVQALFKAYETEGVPRKLIAFKERVTQAALNVNTGEITLNPVFAAQNAGKNNSVDLSGDDLNLKLSIDGRKLCDTKKLTNLIQNIAAEIESGHRPLADLHLFGSCQLFDGIYRSSAAI